MSFPGSPVVYKVVTCSAMDKFLEILPTLYWEAPEKRMSFFLADRDGIERCIEQGWFLIDPAAFDRGRFAARLLPPGDPIGR